VAVAKEAWECEMKERNVEGSYTMPIAGMHNVHYIYGLRTVVVGWSIVRLPNCIRPNIGHLLSRLVFRPLDRTTFIYVLSFKPSIIGKKRCKAFY